jgi:hypothetical protein
MGPIASLEILEKTGEGNRTSKTCFCQASCHVRLVVENACVRLGLKCEVLKFKIGICRPVSRFIGRAREVSSEKLD